MYIIVFYKSEEIVKLRMLFYASISFKNVTVTRGEKKKKDTTRRNAQQEILFQIEFIETRSSNKYLDPKFDKPKKNK